MLLFTVLLMFVVARSRFQLTAAALTTDQLKERLDAVVQRSLDRGDIPGLVLSVVNASTVVVEKGYGVANVSSGQPMTSDTLVPLGSTTKAFASALLALLMDKHDSHGVRFNWSTPVSRLLDSTFQLYDEKLTSETTLEDILSHRTGIPDYFLLLLAGYPSHITRQQLVQSLRYHKPTLPFREEFIYNNHLYVLAGYVAEVLEGHSWEQLIDEYLLQPIGMPSSTFIGNILTRPPDNMAESCGWTEQDGCCPVDIQLLDSVNVATPAGGILSTARDMSRWMMWHLSGGTVPPVDGQSDSVTRRLIDKDLLWETYGERNLAFGRRMNEQTTTNQCERHVAYDLGWMTSYYRGARRVWHSGSILTYKAHVWLYPDANIGIFAALAGPRRYDTSDVFVDLMRALSDLVVFSVQPSVVPEHTRTTSSPDLDGESHLPTRPLTEYVGTYVGRMHVNATVTQDQATGKLRLTLGRMLAADLVRYDCVRNEFDGVIGGRLWWIAEGHPEQAVLPVAFRSSVVGGRPDVLELPLETAEDPVPAGRSRFLRRGLQLPADWTPPAVDNPCSAATVAGLYTWIIIPVVFCYYSVI